MHESDLAKKMAVRIRATSGDDEEEDEVIEDVDLDDL